jgi:methyl-accepting chemotaxis protein
MRLSTLSPHISLKPNPHYPHQPSLLTSDNDPTQLSIQVTVLFPDKGKYRAESFSQAIAGFFSENPKNHSTFTKPHTLPQTEKSSNQQGAKGATMQWFKDLTVRAKLIISFMVLIMLTATLGIFMIVRMTEISKSADILADHELPSTLSISKIGDFFGSYRRGELLLILADKPEDIKKFLTRNQEMQGNLNRELSVYEKMLDTEKEKKDFAAFTSALNSYLAEDPKIAEFAKVNKDAEASEAARGASSKYFNQALKALEVLREAQIKKTIGAAQFMTSQSARSRTLISIALLACIVIGLIEALVLARLLTAPLRTLARKAAQIAEGDLNVTIEQQSRDEVGQLSAAFGTMTGNLRDLIGRLSDTSQRLSSASNELKATAQQITTGTEEVSAQAGTVAVASEEMAATSSDIANNCYLAAESAQQAATTTQQGFAVVEKTVQGIRLRGEEARVNARNIESLGERSDQIGAIVATIEDIADQTNLLALNAAIEAARAGEQGRGFAVVADEVRALAERTTRATREIGEMIKAIQNETALAIVSMEAGVKGSEQGVTEASQLETELHGILEQVNSVSMQVSQIATAAEQQTATTSEITNNITQITQVVQDTSRGAQKSADAASELSAKADELQSLIRHFKI